METTKQRIGRLVPQSLRDKLDSVGLLIVDKQDYQITLDGYTSMSAEVKALRLEVARLKVRLEERSQVKLRI